MDTYLSKLRDLASSTLQVSKLSQAYSTTSTAPQSQAGLWTLQAATRKQTNQPATLWIFSKDFFTQPINRHTLGAQAHTGILARLRQEVSQLARLRHPGIVQVMEPLEETRSHLMFVTERVSTLHALLLQDNLDDVELPRGLLQVCRALGFLHEAGLVHGNLTPECVLVGSQGDWKLAGLGFAHRAATAAQHQNQNQNQHQQLVWHQHWPEHTQRALEFTAPEYVLAPGTHPITPSADLFSLGCLICALHAHGASPLRPTATALSPESYPAMLAKLTQRLPALLPPALQPATQSLLSPAPATRICLEEFRHTAYFTSTAVATLQYLDALATQPVDQKLTFLRAFPRALPGFSPRTRRRILPLLLAHLNDHPLLPYTLPAVFATAQGLIFPENQKPQDADSAEMAAALDKALEPLYVLPGIPPEAQAVLVENLPLIIRLTQTSSKQHKQQKQQGDSEMHPLLRASLTNQADPVRTALLRTIPQLAPSLPPAHLLALLPPLQLTYTRATMLAQKTQALQCIHLLLPHLPRALIKEKVLPMLLKTKTREPDVVMALVEMYRTLGLNTEYLDTKVVARSVLGEVWALAVETEMDEGQVKVLCEVAGLLEERIRKEVRAGSAGRSRVKGSGGLANPLQRMSVDWDHNEEEDDEIKWPMGFAATSAVGSPQPLTQPLQSQPLKPMVLQSTRHTVVSAHKPSGKLGAMKILPQTASSTTTTNLLKLPPPPPPSSLSPNNKPLVNSVSPTPSTLMAPLSALSFGQTYQNQNQKQKQKQLLQQQQKHAGGKSSDLGDFDPFA
ncbi:Protein kinase domain-containing protein ppk32 [Kickxella alabastrina]|uniref:Protein kinase domain-containing protein ppk32 n=1 Tax=Kickxella alabastrina TaxID=61397 RepID=A0ACC1IPU0_9FUNG|nr:Protein kinase domain-containing protein ppk32 [Kickxella alabastrina]